jgi:hypothetical protein
MANGENEYDRQTPAVEPQFDASVSALLPPSPILLLKHGRRVFRDFWQSACVPTVATEECGEGYH